MVMMMTVVVVVVTQMDRGSSASPRAGRLTWAMTSR